MNENIGPKQASLLVMDYWHSIASRMPNVRLIIAQMATVNAVPKSSELL